MISDIPTPGAVYNRKRKLVHLFDEHHLACDIFKRHSTSKSDVIEYFNRVIGLVGCSRDPFVVCRAWCFIREALSAASSCSDTDFRSIKAMVCACVSLAIEVSADFEADYVVSSAGWGHFFFCEITNQSHDNKDISEIGDHCRALMKLKLVISAQFGWNLGRKSSADFFSQMIAAIVSTDTSCDACTAMRNDMVRIVPHSAGVLRSLTCGLLSEGISEQVIAIMAVIVVHETFQSRQACMTYPSQRTKRALRVTRIGLEDRGLCECILKMAEIYLQSAKPLLQARDILMCEQSVASILELPEYITCVPVIRKMDSLFQSGSCTV
jgi:hypothetical protein